MLPQEAVGGWMPKPRNDRTDSTMMTLAMSRVAWTIIGAIAFGSKCRSMIRKSPLPTARAASAYSRSRSERNDALTKRATLGHDKAPMITTITWKLSAAFVELAATIPVSTKSNGKSGIDKNTSVTRISR